MDAYQDNSVSSDIFKDLPDDPKHGLKHAADTKIKPMLVQ
jgi:hypothetical protein